MTTFLIYSIDSGEGLRLLSGHAESVNENTNIGESAVPARGLEDEQLVWVDHATGKINYRADYELNYLPLPCDIKIEGVKYHCTEQPTFEFDAPGKYTIAVDAGTKYLKKEFILDYQPPQPFEA